VRYETDKFWVIKKCKTCGKLHRGGPVKVGPNAFRIPMPMDGIECPDAKGKAVDSASDLVPMTQAEIDSALYLRSV